MKKLTAILLCILAVYALTACGSKSATTSNQQLPNPMVDCDTLADAAKITGFDMTVPDSIDGYDTCTIQVVDNSMIQANYAKGENNLLIRKAAGTKDISGDYTEYAETNTVTVGSLQITMKGENGMVSVATWTDGGNAFAVDAQNVPMTVDAISALIENVQ